jgi:hypothetical protein
LPLRSTNQERLKEMTGTVLRSDAALSEYLIAIHVHGERFPLQATYADPNAIRTEVIACTPRQSRTNRVGHLEGGRVGDVEQQVVGVQLMSMDGTGRTAVAALHVG